MVTQIRWFESTPLDRRSPEHQPVHQLSLKGSSLVTSVFKQHLQGTSFHILLSSAACLSQCPSPCAPSMTTHCSDSLISPPALISILSNWSQNWWAFWEAWLYLASGLYLASDIWLWLVLSAEVVLNVVIFTMWPSLTLDSMSLMQAWQFVCGR